MLNSVAVIEYMCSIINKPLTFGCVCVHMRASFLHGIHELLQTFSRDRVCSLNDEVELVQAPDNAHGRCQADGGQCLDCDSSPRRISWISGKLHRVSQKERCLRRDQKQIPEWNRQDSLWVQSKHSNLIRHFQLMWRLTVILKSDCLLRHRHWQSSNVFIHYWSLAALPNGWEIQFSFYLIAKPAPFTEYIWAPHMTGSERCDWPAKCQSVCFSFLTLPSVSPQCRPGPSSPSPWSPLYSSWRAVSASWRNAVARRRRTRRARRGRATWEWRTWKEER